MSAALLALLVAMSPFEKNDPLTDRGTAAFKAEKFEEAQVNFEAAARERPNDPRAHFNLGATLHKLGRNDEANQALSKAEELDSKHEFTNQIHYNRGTIAAAEGKKEEAIKEYRRALRADPGDELSRHNLEVVLRDLPPKPQPGPDGGSDGGASDGGGNADGGKSQDGGSDAGRPDGGQADAGPSDSGAPTDGGQGDGGSGDAGHGDGGSGDGGSGDGGQGDKPQPGDGGQNDKGQRSDGGADGGAQTDGGPADQGEQPELRPDGGLSKKEAEKALDSMKNGEKNLQLWRFRQKTQKNDNHGKDW